MRKKEGGGDQPNVHLSHFCCGEGRCEKSASADRGSVLGGEELEVMRRGCGAPSSEGAGFCPSIV